jgi:hypothetical protein
MQMPKWQTPGTITTGILASTSAIGLSGKIKGRATGGGHAIEIHQQLKWLRDVAFVDVKCLWHEGRRALVAGFKN